MANFLTIALMEKSLGFILFYPRKILQDVLANASAQVQLRILPSFSSAVELCFILLLHQA